MEGKEIINYPEEIHLTLNGQIDNLDELQSEIDFDWFDHKFTFWHQGLSTSKKDINYVLESKHVALQKQLNEAMYWILKLRNVCEYEIEEFNVPELNDFLNECKK